MNDTLCCYGDICDATHAPRIPKDVELPKLVVSRAVPGGRSTLEPLPPPDTLLQTEGPTGASVQGILWSFHPAPRMLPVGGASTPRKHSAVPNLMEKGLMILQCVACRDNLVPAWKLRQRQQSLSKSAQAIGCFYRKKGEYKEDFSLKDTSFMAELQELRKVFLERPGCPQFSTKATSMSHYGESHERGGPHVETNSLPGGVGPPSRHSSARVVVSGGNSLAFRSTS
ncbi:uncharacterized protein LOC117804418 [Ailuropoda melanoleuca]|uniref:uncharacterized protein LOC117804418 n=1 Tax=Ailuropoda melanoleuca TaxID=9646 RepID=UPI001493DF1E|nr:uncharacterized protein LOC117804418 [Ailuropoda melanoleuca]